MLDFNGTFDTPDWVGSFDATYATGPVLLRYGVTWIDNSTGTYERFASDRATGEVDQALAQAYRDAYLLEVPNNFLHNASIRGFPLR